jgi:hypothetical protein
MTDLLVLADVIMGQVKILQIGVHVDAFKRAYSVI